MSHWNPWLWALLSACNVTLVAMSLACSLIFWDLVCSSLLYEPWESCLCCVALAPQACEGHWLCRLAWEQILRPVSLLLRGLIHFRGCFVFVWNSMRSHVCKTLYCYIIRILVRKKNMGNKSSNPPSLSLGLSCRVPRAGCRAAAGRRRVPEAGGCCVPGTCWGPAIGSPPPLPPAPPSCYRICQENVVGNNWL